MRFFSPLFINSIHIAKDSYIIWPTTYIGKAISSMHIHDAAWRYSWMSACMLKQFRVAAWLECWLSHLGVVGSSPGHDNLWKPLGGINGPCKIVYDWWYKNRQKSVSFSGRISDWLSVVLVRAKPHKRYVTERVWSSVSWCQSLASGAWKYGHISDRLRQRAPRWYFTFTFIYNLSAIS